MSILPSFRRLLVIGVTPATCYFRLWLLFRSEPTALGLLVRVLAGLLAVFALLPSSGWPHPDASNSYVVASTRMVHLSGARSSSGARANAPASAGSPRARRPGSPSTPDAGLGLFCGRGRGSLR